MRGDAVTWAARYSRTEQPELTIYLNGDEMQRESIPLADFPCDNGDQCTLPWLPVGRHAVLNHDPDLRADIAARVPVRECIETDACRNHAVDGERCWDHGGSDPL